MLNRPDSNRFVVLCPAVAMLALSGCARQIVEPEPAAESPLTTVPQPAAVAPLNAIPGPGNSAAESSLERVPADSVMVLPPGDAPARYYEVTAGDTLNAIAARFGVSSAAVVKANGIDNPNALQPGQLLYIPQSR